MTQPSIREHDKITPVWKSMEEVASTPEMQKAYQDWKRQTETYYRWDKKLVRWMRSWL